MNPIKQLHKEMMEDFLNHTGNSLDFIDFFRTYHNRLLKAIEEASPKERKGCLCAVCAEVSTQRKVLREGMVE